MKAGLRTHEVIRLAEGLASVCAWTVAAAIPVGLGLLAALWWWPTVLVGVGMAMVGAGMLRAVAEGRRERALPLLEGFPDQRLPTWALPFRVPSGQKAVGDVVCTRRVHSLRHPDGRRVTAEIAWDQPSGAWLVAWPANRTRPASARGLTVLTHTVVGGLTIASPDVEATEALLGNVSVQQALRVAVPADGEVAVYPFGAWWRSRETVDERVLRQAEEDLRSLVRALRHAAS